MTEIFQDADGQWRYRIKGKNGEIMATSEGYTRPADARRGLLDLRGVLDATEGQAPRLV